MNLKPLLLMLMTVTAYRAVKAQTDDTPNWTSIDQHVHSFGVAASPDLIKSGEVCYGDVVQIPGIGLRIVNDTTNPRLKRTIDVFVDSRAEEHQVGVRHLEVGIIHSEQRFCSRGAYLEATKKLKRYHK